MAAVSTDSSTVPPPGIRVITHSSTFLLPGDGPIDENNILVISQYETLSNFAPRLWTKAPIHIAVDGGANRLFDEMPLFFPTEDPDVIRERYKPDYITGNMNSIRPAVRDYYANLGTPVVDQPSDELVDLHQCVDFIENVLKISNPRILVIGALGGRFDQLCGNINVLYYAVKEFRGTSIVLISHESIVLLLKNSYHHIIHILPEVEGPTCGLLPIGAPSMMTNTSGLVWNLGGRGMAFGGLISTSNLVVPEDENPVVTVDSDADLIWTIKLRPLFPKQIIYNLNYNKD